MSQPYKEVVPTVEARLEKKWKEYFGGQMLNLQKQPPEVFCKNDVLRNFAKFTGKHLCQSLFFNKVAGLQLYLKRYSGTGVFL